MHDAVQRESKAARDSAGILDASTLGKIDIQGTDASEFLNRVIQMLGQSSILENADTV